MKLSPLDIRKQEFTRAFRGYEVDEVDAFLHMVSDQWQELVDELQRAKDRISEQDLRLDHYKKVEEALEVALKTARTSARQTIENAEEKARAILESAESNAVSIQNQAEQERLRLKKDTARFEVRQQEIVAKLRAFLISEMEMLAHFEGESPSGFIKLMPSKDERALARAYLEDKAAGGEEDEGEEAHFIDEPDLEEPISGDEESSGERDVQAFEDAEGEFDETVFEGDDDGSEKDEDVEPEYDVHRDPDERAATTAEPDPDERAATTAEPDPNLDPDDAHLRHRPSRHQPDKDADATDEIKKIRKILEDLDK